MKNCKACGNELAKGVKKCPKCGKDQRSWFMKHKILTIIIIFITLGVVGSGGTEETSSSSKVEGNNKQDDKITLKANSISDWTDPQGFSKPDEGNKYVKINFDITNNSVEDGLGMNPSYFSVETDTAKVDYNFITTVNEPDAETKIKTGVTKKYDLIFEIAQDDKVLDLKYNNMSNKTSTNIKY